MSKGSIAKGTKDSAWFAGLSLAGQAISWGFTFYVIRRLDPSDFGLMTMASLLTAYLQMFSELGVGAAIIQRPELTQKSLSSVFWLALGVGLTMAVATYFLAYPTAIIFSEKAVIPVTQLIAVLFVLGALTTVPYHLLAREFELKKIGIVNLCATVVSGAISVVLAIKGYGVFALIFAHISTSTIKAILFFVASKWRPSPYFSFNEVRPFLKYGIVMALSGTSSRLFETLDKLVIGRYFGANQLGLYGNALSISNMPLEKIWPIFQQTLFPLLAKIHREKGQLESIYLNILKHYLLIVTPIYLGGFIVADDLIVCVLGEKWAALTPLFQMFCIIKLFQVLSSYHTVLENVSGGHVPAFLFNLLLAIVIPLAIWWGAQYSFKHSMLPWILIYPVLCILWLIFGLRRNNICLKKYAITVYRGSLSAMIMFFALLPLKAWATPSHLTHFEKLGYTALMGLILFSLSIWLFQRPMVVATIKLIRTRDIPT